MEPSKKENPLERAMERDRSVLRRNVSIGPKMPIDMIVTKKMAERIGTYDGKQKKEMDPLILSEIDGPHGEAVQYYVEKYKTARESIGGKRKRVRKTRRSKRINGRKQ